MGFFDDEVEREYLLAELEEERRIFYELYSEWDSIREAAPELFKGNSLKLESYLKEHGKNLGEVLRLISDAANHYLDIFNYESSLSRTLVKKGVVPSEELWEKVRKGEESVKNSSKIFGTLDAVINLWLLRRSVLIDCSEAGDLAVALNTYLQGLKEYAQG